MTSSTHGCNSIKKDNATAFKFLQRKGKGKVKLSRIHRAGCDMGLYYQLAFSQAHTRLSPFFLLLGTRKQLTSCILLSLGLSCQTENRVKEKPCIQTESHRTAPSYPPNRELHRIDSVAELPLDLWGVVFKSLSMVPKTPLLPYGQMDRVSFVFPNYYLFEVLVKLIYICLVLEVTHVRKS